MSDRNPSDTMWSYHELAELYPGERADSAPLWLDLVANSLLVGYFVNFLLWVGPATILDDSPFAVLNPLYALVWAAILAPAIIFLTFYGFRDSTNSSRMRLRVATAAMRIRSFFRHRAVLKASARETETQWIAFEPEGLDLDRAAEAILCYSETRPNVPDSNGDQWVITQRGRWTVRVDGAARQLRIFVAANPLQDKITLGQGVELAFDAAKALEKSAVSDSDGYVSKAIGMAKANKAMFGLEPGER